MQLNVNAILNFVLFYIGIFIMARLNRRNIYLASVDTEDNGKGLVQVICFVHEKGSVTLENRNEALEYLLELGKQAKQIKKVVVLGATNLEYDLINLFPQERISEVKLIFGKSALVGGEWQRRNVVFRDTMRFYLNQSVAKLGELVGLPKIEGHLDTISAKKIRCMRDATITYRAFKLLFETLDEWEVNPKMTLPSYAYNIWKDHFWKREVILPDSDIIEHAKEAYFGGRTENFALGEFKNVHVIDVASMYPAAMTEHDMPLPWGLYERINRKTNRTGYEIARVFVSNDTNIIPILPYRNTKGSLIYPRGSFTGWYTGEEIAYAENQGYKVSVLQGYKFLEKVNPFKEYISEMFMRKNASRGSRRELYKLLCNGLYGKFGQRGKKVIALPLEEFSQLRDLPDDYTVWNGIAIYQENAEPPIFGNQVWAAFVTARARIRLHEELMRIIRRGARPLYVDTDSIIYQGPKGRYAEKAEKPGQFEYRGNFAKIVIAGKKEYGLCDRKGIWTFHVKGVPASSREAYLFNGKATYQKPIRLRESARRNITANIWHDVTKERHVSFKNRIRDRDGFLQPITIKE